MRTREALPDREELLQSLSSAFGVSGDEVEVMGILERYLQERFRGSKDRFGNRMFYRQGQEEVPKILFAAHADEIGFMVHSIHPKGYLFLVPIGAWGPISALGMPVEVKGRKGRVCGVIGTIPPHHQRATEKSHLPGWEEMWVDIGAHDEKEVRDEFGVERGNLVAPAPLFERLLDGRALMGKAWDNRVGCALLVESLLQLEESRHPNSVWAVATTQEEIGSRGAWVVREQVDADVAIILEGAPADDFPSRSSWECQAAMGSGVQIRAYDLNMVGNPRLRDFLVGIAEAEGIPFQVAVQRGGATDGGPIHQAGQGIPTVVLAVPVRYAHNRAGLIEVADYEACLRLLVAGTLRISQEVIPTLSC